MAALLRWANPVVPARPASLPPPDVWPDVLRAAVAHRLSGLLCERCLHPDVSPSLPLAARSALEGERAALVGEVLRRVVQLHEVLDTLAHAGVDARPFKGPALSVLVYGQPFLRRTDDLDVLVLRADAVRARTALVTAGFVSTTPDSRGYDAYLGVTGKHFALERARDDLLVEVHWSFSDRFQPFRLDAEDVWARRQEVVLLGRSLPTLATEDYLLVLAVHAYRHGWCLLEHVASVAALVERHGDRWGAGTWARAERLGIRRVVAVTLGLAVRLFDAPGAARMLAIAPCDRVATRLAAQLKGRLCEERVCPLRPAEEALLAWRSRERWGDRLRWFAAHPRLTAPPVRSALGWLGIGLCRGWSGATTRQLP